ncbi:hypothetical protein GF373_17235 [bacterium]|nr:hypothetical protein [bacterium]
MHLAWPAETTSSRIATVILVLTGDQGTFAAVREALWDGYACFHAASREAAEAALAKQHIHLLIINPTEPGNTGIDLLRFVKEYYPYISVIYMGENPSFELIRTVLSGYKGIREMYKLPAREKKKEKNWPLQEKKHRRRARLAEIEALIRENPKHYNSGILARKFKITERQIRMDIRELKDRGCPILREENKYFMGEKEKKRK